MKYIMTSLTALVFTSSIAVAEITVINAGSATGLNVQTLTEAETVLGKIDVKTTRGNCAIAKQLWQTSQKAFFIMPTNGVNTLKENQECFIDVGKENFLITLWVDEYKFCAVKPGLTWEDFVRPGSEHTVSVMPNLTVEKFIDDLAKLNNKTVRIVRHATLAPFVISAKAGEIDFTFRPAMPADMRDNCFFGGSETPIHVRAKTVELGFLAVKGYTNSEVAAFREKLGKFVTSEGFQKILIGRGINPQLSVYPSYEDMYNEFREMFVQSNK